MVYCICATCGRHKLMERSLAMFLNQDYRGEHTLIIFNNSDKEIQLGGMDMDKDQHVLLVNAGSGWNSLGDIYNGAIKYVVDGIVTHWDDDDLFLPNHISEGVKGLERGNKTAYKPAKSWFRHPQGIELINNVLEPSMFVKAEHIKKYGYSNTTTDQHLQWVNPLVSESEIYVDESGPATLIYNWGDVEIPTWKTSGGGATPECFINYRAFSQDHGDGILTPWSLDKLEKYYKLTNG